MSNADSSLFAQADTPAPETPEQPDATAPASLEDCLREHESDVDGLLKSAASYVSALKAWKKACQAGHMANRQRYADKANALAGELAGPARDAADAWVFDVEQWLSDGTWHEEIAREMRERYGLRAIADPSGALVCPPVVLQAEPGRNRLKAMTKAMPDIRPSAVAGTLKRIRDRAAEANNQEFIEALYAATKYLSHDKGELYATFRDIYNLYALTPGWKKANAEVEFGQAIYALHASQLRATRDGHTVQFETPAGKPRERDIFSVYGEDGVLRRYWGVRFL